MAAEPYAPVRRVHPSSASSRHEGRPARRRRRRGEDGRGPRRTVGPRPDGRRQHRRRPRAPRPGDLARPRHGRLHAGRARRRGPRLGRPRRDLDRDGSARGARRARTWFRLGDRDLATHIWRTDRLRAGDRPTEVALELAAAMGIESTHPADGRRAVRTEVRTDDGWLEFQEYFVHRHQEPDGPRGPLPRHRDGAADARGPRRASTRPRSSSSRRRTRSCRSARSWPCPGCATRWSGGPRPRRAGRRGQRDHRRQGAQGPGRPDARVARRGVERARRGARGTRRSSATSSSTTSTRASLPAIAEASASRPSSPTRS